ncbi:hypothetical protein ACNFIA_17955 [Pseudomonas sp. NY15437]|uniref:hypothetical protein n=1 Tax=Pseudomonas sp. NY15437 TaxID=3400360 RepID=UPI003A83D16A
MKTLALAACLVLAGCSGGRSLLPVTETDLQDRSLIVGAQQAIQRGQFQDAEKLLSKFVYRTPEGDLKMSQLMMNGKSRKMVIDTVVSLLWETGRDQTLAQFAKAYLSGDEYQITMCRLAERQSHFPEAYACWNKIGNEDRAERTIRTEAALRILGTE